MILVTGATGFIGSRLVERLSADKKKEAILCLTSDQGNSQKEKTSLASIKKLGLNFLEVDLLTGRGLDKIPKSPKIIFHLAANTDTAVKDHRVNEIGTQNLLEAVKPIGPETHFIFTSSIAINDIREDYSHPVDETTAVPKRPCHEYGRRKLKSEQYLIQQAKEWGFGLSIVRVCGVYGKGVRKGGLFDSIDTLVKKGSFLARLNWPGRISIIHLKDMVNFLILVSLLTPQPGDYKIYIPSVEALSLAQMSQIIHEAYAIDYKPIHLPAWVWEMGSILAKSKPTLEAILPHKLYNKFWQGSILINNEYWNTSQTIQQVLKDKKPITFREYYRNRVGGSLK